MLTQDHILMLNFDPWSHFNVEKMNRDHMLVLKIDQYVIN